MAAIAGALIARYAKRDIDFAEKCGGGQCWGYELSEYVVSGRVTLRFWGDWGLDTEYVLPAGRVERASENRWLAVDRALVLDLRWRPPASPSDGEAVPIRVLYDFQRGETSVWSALPLWRMGDYRGARPDRNWMNETQFRAALDAIQP